MKALKAFTYSHNGVDPIHLAAGDDASDVPESALPGLIAEGYVGDGSAKPAKAKNKADRPTETGAPVALEGLSDKGDDE